MWRQRRIEIVGLWVFKGGFKEVFVDMFKVFNRKDRFIEVQKEKYKDGRVKVYNQLTNLHSCH